MKKIFLCSLAVAGIFGATSASAATYTTDLFYTMVNSAKTSTGGDSQWRLISDGTGQYVTYTTPNEVLAIPSSNVNSFVSAFNTLLQTPECSASTVSANGGVSMPSTYCVGKTQELYATYLNLQATSTALPPTTSSSAIAKTITETISTTVTPQIQRATSVQQASIISSVLSNIFSSRSPNAPGAPLRVSLDRNEKGMAAGDAPSKLNAWVNVSDTSIGSSATASLFNGNVNNAIGGVDYRFSNNFVAGVSTGYDRVALDFKFAGLTNSGLVSKGWMVAPYASYQINEMFSVDGTYGYAAGDVDTRTNGVYSKQTYDRNFFALNLNANYWISDWQLTGKANYISAEEKVATTNKMEQLRLGGQVGYWIGGVMPYVGLTYVRDLKVSTGGIQPASLDKEAWVASIGANLFTKGALSGGISYIEEFGRTDSKNYTFMANIGYRF